MVPELIALTKGGQEILKNIYIDLAQPGVRQVGIALETVLETGNTILLPIKLVNEKTRLIFQNNMNKYRMQLENVNEGDIISVPCELGVPIMDKFTYISNEYISDMFVNLLSKASSKNTVEFAHPRFLQIINCLSVDEARIIKELVVNPNIPFIHYKLDYKEGGLFTQIPKCMTGLEFKIDFIYPQNIQLYLDNMVSCGILTISHDRFYKEQQIYDELTEQYKSHQQYLELNYSSDLHKKPARVEKGICFVTDLGEMFVQACFPQEQLT